MTADQIIEGILGKEGGYVDHPSDKGGPTRWGITQTTARAHGYTGDMRNLPRETAKQILLSDYWTGPRFDQVAALSTLLADELCDTGVNMGPSVASKFFQRWLTALNMRGKLYPDLIPDGAIGPRTITALKGYLSARGKEGEQVLLRALNCSQGARYLELAEPTKIFSTAGLRSVSCEDDHFRFARAGGCARSVTSAQIYPAGVRRPCQPAAENVVCKAGSYRRAGWCMGAVVPGCCAACLGDAAAGYQKYPATKHRGTD